MSLSHDEYMKHKDRLEIEEHKQFLDAIQSKGQRICRQAVLDKIKTKPIEDIFIYAFEQGAIEAHRYLRKV